MKRASAYQSSHWKKLRKRLIENNDEAFCMLCGKKAWRFLKKSGERRKVFSPTLHHKTYERAGQELDTDLILLCHSCHSLMHDIDRRVDSDGFIHELKAVVRKYVGEVIS